MDMTIRRYKCLVDDSIIVDFDTYTYRLKRDVRFRRTLDNTPLSGDIEKWILLNKPGKSMAPKGKKWYNNGEIERYSFERPEGFTEGRLAFSKEAIANMRAAAQRLVLNGGNRHLKGTIPYNKGKKAPLSQINKKSKKTINTETGVLYKSVKELLEIEHISKSQFYKDKKNGKYKTASY